LLPPLLVKPGCTFDEFLDRGLGQPQPLAAEAIAQEVEAMLDPANEGLVGVLLQPQRAEDFVDQPYGAAQFPAGRREDENVTRRAGGVTGS
jgi:hypothetical protein